jgi:hypothetical protein
VKFSCLAVPLFIGQHVRMTNDKFQTMCERILVPRIGNMMRVELVEMNDLLELMQAELVRIGKLLDAISTGDQGGR